MTEFGNSGVEMPPDGQKGQPETEMPFVDADWQQIPFSEMTSRPLKPFQVITDIPTISACQAVEEQVAHSILDPYIAASPSSKKDGIFFRRTQGIGFKPISNYLRPDGFNGSATNTRAILLPFDPEVALEYNRRLRTQL